MERAPIRYHPDLEVPQPDEAALTTEIVERMAAMQAANAERHRHAHRDAHAKSHAVITGRMTVHAGLSPELAQGIFAAPRDYEVVARLSSAQGDIHSDAVPAPRGFAIKVIGVEGERLSPELGGANQDFLMVNFPTLAFGTIAKYKTMLGLLETNAGAPETLQRLTAAAARGVKGAVEALGGTANATVDGLARDFANMLGETFHSQAAIRFGDHVAKLSLAPLGEVAALSGQAIKPGFSTMRDAVVAHFARHGARYELRAQLCVDTQAMPIEDAAILWDPETSPHRAVATLTFAPQDAYSPGRQVFGDDHLAFNPWNGVAAHRPLGGIMRIRKAAYESSSAQRHRLNALERREPTSLEAVPD
ncbi:catalase family protein [Aureimonas altamirensis]|uniref:catalase family protein n=1 Tax=Aureimonas altamirensis TaxID=370622 RepID=UPI002036D012|nr:catalase family protein [Aureimonas altamirensis]MCM2504125.1 catalase family protein [Aureimonas altamirensis]